MDMKNDFRKIIIAELKRFRISFDESKDTAKLCIEYFQVFDKLFILQGKSKVEFSKELIDKLAGFDKDTVAAIDDIKSKLEAGQDISPYLSNDIRKAQKADMLLRNWNIYHAHVKMPLLNRKKKATRSENLLFFTHDRDTVYFIDVLPHPKGDEWFSTELLNIIYDNWKQLLRIAPGVTDFSPKMTDKEFTRGMASFCLLAKVRDCVVFPTNLGVASSGDSVMAVKKADNYLNSLTLLQDFLVESENDILMRIEKEIDKKFDRGTLQLISINIGRGQFVLRNSRGDLILTIGFEEGADDNHSYSVAWEVY